MKRFLLALLFLIPLFANATDCNGFRPFHGGLASQGAHAKASCTCDSCHQGGFSRGTAPSTCVGCHMGQRPTAMQKTPGHIQTGSIGCENCHSASSMSFDDAKMNHTGITSGCATCHKQSATHIATGMECTVCHNTSNFTSWSCGGQ